MTDKQKISNDINKMIDRIIIKYPKFKIDINYEINKNR
jgi:hypothetical protein